MSTVYHDFIPLYVGGPAAITPATFTATDVAVIVVPYRCQVRRVQSLISSNVSAGTATYLFDQRITAGSDTGRVTFATLSKPASNQQGKLLYEDPTASVVLVPGDEIVVKARAAGATSIPAASHTVLVERIPEVPANEADMVAA